MTRWLGVVWWLCASCFFVGFAVWFWWTCFSPSFHDVSDKYGFWYTASLFGLADVVIMLSLYEALNTLAFALELIYPDPKDLS